MLFIISRKLRKQLDALINRAAELGLPEKDISFAKDFLQYNEFGLSFDQVATQLYEYNIHIDNQFYERCEKVIGLLHLNEGEYDYLKELLM